MNPTILLTFDIEDWFQVENFKPYIPFSSWPRRELRVEKNTHKLLDLLDQQSDQPINGSGQRTRPPRLSPPVTARHERAGESDGGQATDNGPDEKVQGTFFVLGWIAERLPHLVKQIHSRGHEVASHGYSHELCNKCSQADLEEDLVRSKKLLEDIIGEPVYGYRAPSFSINDDILKIIEECGYLYDSSFNSFAMHGRYGHLNISRNNARGIAIKISDPRPSNAERLPRKMHGSASVANLTEAEPRTLNAERRTFYELPISNLPLFPLPTLGILAHFRHFCLPLGGGGYFRLIPFPLFKIGAKCILGRQKACLFYFHPWEIDPDQPKVSDAPLSYRFRHYVNLNKTHLKLSKFVESFSHCSFITCYQYLQRERR